VLKRKITMTLPGIELEISISYLITLLTDPLQLTRQQALKID
jgi:hypothetical protein